jgi:hypothetical protein
MAAGVGPAVAEDSGLRTISGTIVDQNGVAAAGVVVTLTQPFASNSWQTSTDAAGHYAFPGRYPSDVQDLGYYHLTASGHPYAASKRWLSDADFGDGKADFDLGDSDQPGHDAVIQRPTWLLISVRDSDGKLVSGTNPAAYVGSSAHPCVREEIPPPIDGDMLICPKSGQVHVDFTFYHQGDRNISEVFDSSYGDVITKQYTLPAMETVSGRIVDANGSPMKGVDVQAGSSDCSEGATTRSSGKFSFTCADGTSAELRATTENWSYVNAHAHFVVGTDAVNLGDVVMRTAAKARIKILKDTGKTLGGDPHLVPYRKVGSRWQEIDSVDLNYGGRRGDSAKGILSLGSLPAGTYKFLASESVDWDGRGTAPVSTRERRWVRGGKTYKLHTGHLTALPTTELRKAYKTTLSITSFAVPSTTPGSPTVSVRVKADGTSSSPTGAFDYVFEKSNGEDIGGEPTVSLHTSDNGRLTITGPPMGAGNYRVKVRFQGTGRFQDARYGVVQTFTIPPPSA